MTLILIVALPLIGALAVLGVGHRSIPAVQLLGTAPLVAGWLIALVVAAQHWGNADATRYTAERVATGGIAIRPALAADQLTASMLVLATTVALLVQVYSVAYMGRDPRYPSYTAFVLLFTSAMALVVSADDFFVLLIGWEMMGACSYFLIAHYWEREPARAGAVRAFLMTRLGDVGLLFGIFEAGRAAGTYRISGLLAAVRNDRLSSGEVTAISLLLLCGVVGKSAQFPLHTWLPDAMPGPTPITALIHAATMVAAGVYLVARLMPLYARSTVALDALAVISVVTLLGSACFALVSQDLKRVLAWSTVSQLAYMFAALSLRGYREGVLHLLSHGAFKALLFLAAGSVILVMGRQQLGELGGLWRSMPVTFATMTVGLAALAGIPPFVGFFSKDAVIGLAAHDAANGSGRAVPVLVATLLGAGLTAAYALRVWLLVFFGTAPPEEALPEKPAPVAGDPSPLITVPLILLAAVTTAAGAAVIHPGFLGVSAPPLNLGATTASLALVAIGLAATYLGWRRLRQRDPALLLGRLRRPLARELAFNSVLDAAAVRTTVAASRATATVESDAVMPSVSRTDALAQLAGRGLRWMHAGNISAYLTAVVVGAVAVALVVGAVQG
jgi:NADH-quinone oxidoreductase subunit L